MKQNINIVVFLTSMYYLTWNKQVEGSDSSFEQTKECSTYSEKLVSFPDLHNMIRYKARRLDDFEIDSVKNTNRERSFYWCELDIEESDTVYRRYRHFGFNSTHWWVEKGCGGWFKVTECRPTVTSQAEATSVLSFGNEVADLTIHNDHDQDLDDEEEREYDNVMSPQILDNLAPTSGILGVGSGQTTISKGRAPLTPTSGNNREVISSGRQNDTKMSHSSNKNAVEENAVQGGPGGSTKADYASRVDILSPQSARGARYDPARNQGPTGISAVAATGADTTVDEMYKGWPRLGYSYPTSLDMWEALDRATWVDVKAQLGFYTKYGGANSNIFD